METRMSSRIASRRDQELRTEIEVDPVCDKPVSLKQFEQDDLMIDYAGRLYVFCSVGCRAAFLADPAAFAVSGRDQP